MAQGVLERFDSPEEELRLAIEHAAANLRVSLPGIIISFDADKQTAVVQPVITENIRLGQDEAKPIPLPLLTDVPVFFPRAGGYCLTFPVKPGCECTLLFSDMCIDGWWQSGGVQDQVETRRHDLSDAQAFLGITSQPRRVKNYSTNSVMLRNEDKDSYFEIVDDDKTVNIISEEKINETAKDDINVTTLKSRNVIVEEDDTVDVTGRAKYTSADTDIESGKPVGINGSGILLGEGNLRKYWSGEQKGWLQQFIPPVPLGIPLIPPAPPLICMGLNNIRAKHRANASSASSINSKVLK